MLDCLAQFCINGINGMAAVGNGIILLAPLKQRDEKEAEAGIGHKNGNTAQASTFFADYRLPKVFKFLFALKIPPIKNIKSHPIARIYFTTLG